MSYYLPTLKDLMQKARLSFRANLKGSDASVWPNNVYVSAKVLAGALFELFGFAAYIKKQIFAHQAPDLDSLGMHGTEYSIPQKPAGPASGNYVISVTDNIVVETNAVLQRTDGLEFLVTTGGTLSTSGTLNVPIFDGGCV